MYCVPESQIQVEIDIDKLPILSTFCCKYCKNLVSLQFIYKENGLCHKLTLFIPDSSGCSALSTNKCAELCRNIGKMTREG